MKTYQLSATGRRTTLVLLVGALAIWVFAFWSFRSFWETLSADAFANPNVSQIVPALLMLVLIVATPLLIWNLLEEWAAGYTLTDDGLRFTSLGIDITFPWQDIQAVRRVDDDSDEPLDELLITGSHLGQISNPVVRFLHAQGYGRSKLPIYAGIADRDELIAAITQRVQPPASVTPPVEARAAEAEPGGE